MSVFDLGTKLDRETLIDLIAQARPGGRDADD
jgi:hypothetical protein